MSKQWVECSICKLVFRASKLVPIDRIDRLNNTKQTIWVDKRCKDKLIRETKKRLKG